MSEKELVQAEEVVASAVEETAAETPVASAVEAVESTESVEAVEAEAAVETVEEAVVAEPVAVDDAPVTAEVAVEAVEEAVVAEPAASDDAPVASEVVEASAPVAEVAAAGDSQGDDEDGPVVKLLSVGQPIQGTVKRITEFGAFVDIGVGRDGLVHISELSTTRVAKVNDVLSEGQEFTFWIKKLDRDRNRISLTLIEPGQRTIRDLQVGEVVEGTVTRILPYGAFIDIGVGRDALLHVREMAEGFVAKPEDVVKPGEAVEVRIIEVARRRNRIDVSMKGLRPEPEQPAAAAAVEEVVAEDDAEVEDRFADIEALTTMQMAFLKAQERSGVTLPTSKKKSKRNDAARKRAAQEDIIARTLSAQPGNPPAKK